MAIKECDQEHAIDDQLRESAQAIIEEMIKQTERGTTLLRSELDGRRDFARIIIQLSTALITILVALLNVRWSIINFKLHLIEVALVMCAVALSLSLASLWRSLEIYSAGFLVAAHSPKVLEAISEWTSMVTEDAEMGNSLEMVIRPIVDPLIVKTARMAQRALWLLKAAVVAYALALIVLVLAGIRG